MADAAQEEPESRPLSALEFEVSRVVRRLEAGVALRGTGGERPPSPPHPPPAANKISVDFFQPRESSLDDILTSVEDLLARTEGGGGEAEAGAAGGGCALPPATPLVCTAALAHSLVAYLGLLERSHLARINAHVAAETTRWITHMFRFVDYSAYYHHDHLEGLVRVTRMMLHYKYPRYLEDGALALTSRLPCIYSSVASPLGVVQHLCRQLGLPLACIRPVPVNTTFGSNQIMDVSALERLMAEDAASEARVPLAVLADAGTATLGHSDALARLGELCRARDVWLHVRGHALAALAVAPPPPPSPHPAHNSKIADSVTLTLGTWFGIPGLPVVTLYRLPEPALSNDHSRTVSAVSSTRESTLPLLGGLAGSEHSARRLPALPLWCCVRAAGHAALVRRLTAAFRSCYLLHALLVDLPAVTILSKPPGGEGGAISLTDLTTKPIDTATLLEVATPCVVFQFAPAPAEGEAAARRRPPAYYDKLNSWLGQILQREVEQMQVDICETEAHGVVLRYCPLEAPPPAEEAPEPERLAAVRECLQQQLEILQATVALKDTFAERAAAHPALRLTDIPGWAGLGGVRYVPPGWAALPPEQTRDELNHLNRALVDALRNTDSAFSCGDGDDGMACVRFGMVTADTDVEELLALVVAVGREVEEQSKVLDTMTEIVKKGIEAATADLQRESEERLWQEGLLRHVPVVGRVVDWWSPLAARGLRGRCLHLSQGTVESTENIYKYHMQIPAGTVPHGVARAPPPAEVQTPVGPPLPPAAAPGAPARDHSRSSSHASHTSHADPPTHHNT